MLDITQMWRNSFHIWKHCIIKCYKMIVILTYIDRHYVIVTTTVSILLFHQLITVNQQCNWGHTISFQVIKKPTFMSVWTWYLKQQTHVFLCQIQDIGSELLLFLLTCGWSSLRRLEMPNCDDRILGTYICVIQYFVNKFVLINIFEVNIGNTEMILQNAYGHEYLSK